MTLAAALRQHWASSPGLAALLPTERLFTGQAVDPQRPYAVMHGFEGTQQGHFGDGSKLESIAVELCIHDDDFARLQQITAAARAAFDGAALSLTSSSRVLAIEVSNGGQTQDDRGHWRATLTLACHVLG
ncbi:MAG: tail completion protein gp17 [Planctomycetota bacterium]